VPIAENILRGFCPSAINKRKTHCHRGHPLFGSNSAVYPSHGPGRTCKQCQRERRMKKYWAARVHANA
jgi:hypothetical protein